ncbi:MAG: hypothetical protein NTY71_01110 [Methanoregula sp.]|nr:hypothetical protein [Methanoregula sp.]
MQSRISLIIIICAAIAIAGCMGTQNPPVTPTPTSGTSTTTSPTGGSLVPSPTDTMPANSAVSVTVGEKEYTGNILVTFDGGKGQINVQRIDVKLTRFDGSVYSTTLGKNKGDEVVLEGTRGEGGSRGQPDRIEVWVAMNNGQTYKIIDVLREYRTRG